MVIDRFLPHLQELLSEKKGAVCFMVLVRENKPHELRQVLGRQYGLNLETILERRARNEHLQIVKITRQSSDDETKLNTSL